jgi:glycosyltransferase involved in cell wall biosynthesis
LRILFLSENFSPETNAAASRVFERAKLWADWGHEVTVVTSAPNFPQGKLYPGYRNRWWQAETMAGIRVVRVKTYMAPNRGVAFRTLDFVSFLATGSVAALFERRPNVVAATSPQFFAAVAGWLIGAIRRVPFVFELGDIWPASIVAVGAMKPSRALRALEALELFLYRRSAAVAALTTAFRDNLVRRGIPRDKIAVVRNGVDLDRFSPRPRSRELEGRLGLAGKFVVGYVGTHGMAHGLGNVLGAAEILRGQEDVRFLLVGDGAERAELIASAKAHALENVVFAPPQPKEAMPDVWSLCDVALVHLRDTPDFAEVIPSKIFEAMAMGLPILLCLPEGEASRLVLGEGVGMHVAPGDPVALADAVQGIRTDDAKRRTLAARSLAAAPNYSRRVQAEEMLQVLTLAAARQGHRAAAVNRAVATEPGSSAASWRRRP